MNKELSKPTKFSLWVLTCVFIGLSTAAYDGVPLVGVFRVAIAVCIIMILGLITFVMLGGKKNE